MFRFYGLTPADWDEGACEGHSFVVQFRQPPTTQQRAQIANLFEQRLAAGAATPAREPWLWSERFARLLVGERGLSGGTTPAFVHAVSEFLKEVHESVPVIDVVFQGARDCGESPLLAPGPAALCRAADIRLCRTVDPSLPEPAPDASFEDARRASRASLEAAKIAEILSQSKALKLGLKPSEAKVPPAVPAQSPPAKKIESILERANLFLLHPAAVGEAGGWWLVYADSGVYRVRLDTGAVRPVFVPDAGWVTRAAYLPADQVVVATNKELRFIDVSGETPRLLTSLKGGVETLAVARDGKLLLCGWKVRLVGYAKGRAKVLGSLDTKLIAFAAEAEGRVLYTDSSGNVYELANLEAVLEEFEAEAERAVAKKQGVEETAKGSPESTAPPKRTKQKATAESSALPEAVAKPLDPTEIPEDDEAAKREQLRVDDSAPFRVAPGCGIAALRKDAQGDYTTLVLLDQQGLKEVDLSAVRSPRGFDLSKDGALYLAASGSFCRAKPIDSTPEVILPVDLNKRPPNYPADVCLLDERTLLVLGNQRLELLRPQEDGCWQLTGSLKLRSGERLIPCRKHGVVVVLTNRPEERLVVVGILKPKDKLVVLATLAGWTKIAKVVEDSRIFFCDVNNKAWEVELRAQKAEA